MGRPLKSLNRDTRQLILDVALEKFATVGYTETSVRDLSKAIGVSESALYAHFTGKDAILASIFETFSRPRAGGGPRAAPATAADAESLLVNMIMGIVKSWLDPKQRLFHRLSVMESLRDRSYETGAIRQSVDKTKDGLAQMFGDLVERQLIKAIDLELLSLEFMGPLVTMRNQFLVFNRGPVDHERLLAAAEKHAHFFWNAVKA